MASERAVVCESREVPDRALTAAAEEHRITETATRQRWDSTPQTLEGIESWAVTVARQAVDADLRVTKTQEREGEARQAQQHLTSEQDEERADLRREVLGNRPAGGSARAQARRWRERAGAARRDLAAIKALPVTEAAQLLRARAEHEKTQREAAERALTQRQTGAAQRDDFGRRPSQYGPSSPDRGLAL